MTLYIGNKGVAELYYGNKKIKEAYLGNKLVYTGFIPIASRFFYTGSSQTFTVPEGCNYLVVGCWGAASGRVKRRNANNYSNRVFGGSVQCVLAVSENQVLNLYIGGKGADATGTTSGATLAGGYNGGANGIDYTSAYYVPWSVAGGGGATDIRIGGTALNNRVIVAGGAGAPAYNWSSTSTEYVNDGGAGGGLIGGSGSTAYSGDTTPATGGTQSAGGTGETISGAEPGNSGSLGVGGSYGGGGGYYGGGGAILLAGAGGGSSYTHPTLCTQVTHVQGDNSDDGYIFLTTSRGVPSKYYGYMWSHAGTADITLYYAKAPITTTGTYTVYFINEEWYDDNAVSLKISTHTYTVTSVEGGGNRLVGTMDGDPSFVLVREPTTDFLGPSA